MVGRRGQGAGRGILHSRYAGISGAAHGLPFQCPAQVNALLKEHLAGACPEHVIAVMLSHPSADADLCASP